ncbi:MAG: AEC family transporter [Pseudomonadota bacterium]
MVFLSAVLPIFFVLVLGKALAMSPLLDRAGWNAIERLGLYVLFPALIVNVLATASFDWAALKLIGVLIGAQMVLGAVGVGAKFVFSIPGPTAASIIQSNVRWNTFIGLSIAQSLYGSEGLALMAVAAAGMIPTANLLSISAFEGFSETSSTLRERTVSVLINPLILACLIGGGLGLTSLSMPGVLSDALDLVARAAIAIGLLCAGAALDFSSLKAARLRLAVWSIVRLFGLPAVVAAIAWSVQLTGLPLYVALIAAATPTATNGVVLARQMQGDAVLAANLVAIQSMLSVATIPFLLWAFTTS